MAKPNKPIMSGGIFEDAHQNPPKAFNPDYRPYAADVQHKVVDDMSREGFYQKHSREECAAEVRKRYDAEMARREPAFQAAGGIDNPAFYHPVAREIEDGRRKPDIMRIHELMGSMTPTEKRDCIRFMETCDDNEGYDVPKRRMERLAELGLVVAHPRGVFETSFMLLDMREMLEQEQQHLAKIERAAKGSEGPAPG